jgi:hypothetical protein
MRRHRSYSVFPKYDGQLLLNPPTKRQRSKRIKKKLKNATHTSRNPFLLHISHLKLFHKIWEGEEKKKKKKRKKCVKFNHGIKPLKTVMAQ